MLVVGSNHRALRYIQQIIENADSGLRCIGIVDDGWFGDCLQAESPAPLIGGLDNLASILRLSAIDEVAIALPMASFYHRNANIVALCETHRFRVRIVGHLFDSNMTMVQPSRANGTPIWTVHDPNWSELAAFGKRLADVLISGALLLTCLPVLVLIAAMIASTSEGPIFYQQSRLGLAKKPFKTIKFRSMVVNASSMLKQLESLKETNGPTFKLKNDPRITTVGKFLRRTSLDELHQLLNVLRGEMSMVGPRPLPFRDYEGFSDDRHRRRFSVKPGITCLWQIKGRSTITFEEWMRLDNEYIDRQSLWLDFKILMQTVPAVVRGSGAM